MHRMLDAEVHWSPCVSVTAVSPAKTTEPSEMSFGGGADLRALDGRKLANTNELSVPVVKAAVSLSSLKQAVQARRRQS